MIHSVYFLDNTFESVPQTNYYWKRMRVQELINRVDGLREKIFVQKGLVNPSDFRDE